MFLLDLNSDPSYFLQNIKIVLLLSNSNCGSMSPYTKNLFGWINMEEITENGTYELQASSSSNTVFVIQQGFPVGEYLILEYRSDLDSTYDRGLSQRGLVVYHVDEYATNQPSYPGRHNYPQDHYTVSILQGDGRYDLERGDEEGDAGDVYGVRFSGLTPDGVLVADGTASKSTYPNTNSYQDGQETSSGIVISDITIPDTTIAFTVTFQNAK
jgi:hypothetical protein